MHKYVPSKSLRCHPDFRTMFDEAMCANVSTGLSLVALRCPRRSLALLIASSLSLAPNAFSGPATNTIQFNREVRPILSENCFACHGHDKNQRKAKLRLDVRDVALEKEAIVPGKPEASKLVEHIFSTDA